MNINQYLKPGKNIVIELHDEVEYLLDDEAVEEIESGNEKVTLKRFADRVSVIMEVGAIENTLQKGGIVDYIDKVS